MKHAATLALLALTSCASVRSSYMDWRNEDLEGSVAPALASGTWVHVEDAEGLAGVAPEGWAPADADWRLLVFFLPD